ncbi:hypothetical protein CEXT_209311 [Caerostris extrusa]|uniref:Uncharacterized protein n=1 Tax=Caerostris extrusa TaxID=172846 RepID=A0AAV4TZA5_CAEEX|nr:hypothetical protein CEXT_209311 [Caerostris extrusa]
MSRLSARLVLNGKHGTAAYQKLSVSSCGILTGAGGGWRVVHLIYKLQDSDTNSYVERTENFRPFTGYEDDATLCWNIANCHAKLSNGEQNSSLANFQKSIPPTTNRNHEAESAASPRMAMSSWHVKRIRSPAIMTRNGCEGRTRLLPITVRWINLGSHEMSAELAGPLISHSEGF